MKLIQGRYVLYLTISKTLHSVIKQGVDNYTGHKVAGKLQVRNSTSLIEREVKILEELQGGPGIPILYSHGSQGSWVFMIIEYLGNPLYSYKGIHTLPILIHYIDQALETLNFIHSRNIIHRNIQPCNLITGKKSNKLRLYIIHYSQASQVDSSYITHNQEVENSYFASLNAISGLNQSFRDDLESLIYCMIWLYRQKMPWDMQEKLRTVSVLKTIKLGLSLEKICQDCPSEFLEILRYTRGLKYGEMPDYKYIRSSLRDLGLKTSSIQYSVVCHNDMCGELQGNKLSCESIEDSSAYVDTEEEEFSGVITKEFRMKVQETKEKR